MEESINVLEQSLKQGLNGVEFTMPNKETAEQTMNGLVKVWNTLNKGQYIYIGVEKIGPYYYRGLFRRII